MEILELKVQVDKSELATLQADVAKLQNKTVRISVEAVGFNELDKSTMKNIRGVSQFVRAATAAEKQSNQLALAQQKVALQTQKTAEATQKAIAAERRRATQVAKTSTVQAQTILQAEKTRTEQARAATQAERTATANAKAAASVKQVGAATASATKSTHLLGDSLGNIAVRMAAWQVMGELVSKPIAAFKEAIQTMKEVDSELVNIQKVTGSTDAEMQRLTESAYEMASSYGRTATEVLSASTEFARAGYGDQIESLSEMSILLQNVGDISSETANKFLLSVDAAWKLGGSEKELMAVMDGLNEITNRNATDMDKLATGMTVAASYFAESGETIQTFSALMGAGTAITQRSGAEIGRALKAVTMNIRQIRGETEDGELINDESIAKAAAALKEFAGISTMENGELRLTSEVLDELAGKWDTLGEVQQSAIAEALGGKYHSNVVMALMGDWEKVEKMMTDYAEGAGSAMRENEIYMDSWEAKSKKFSATWTEFISHMVDTGTVKGALDGVTYLIEALDTDLGHLVVTAGLASAAIALIGSGGVRGVKGVKTLVDDVSGLAKMVPWLSEAALLLPNFIKALGGMATGSAAASSAMVWLTEAMLANPLFIGGAAVAGAFGIAKVIDGVTTTVEEQRDKVAELQAEYDALSGPESEYASLIAKAADGTDQLTAAEQRRLEVLREEANELRNQIKAAKELEFERFQKEQGSGAVVFEGADRYRTPVSADEARLNELADAQKRLNAAFVEGTTSETEYRSGLQSLIEEQQAYYDALSEYKDLGFELSDAENQFLETFDLMVDRLTNTELGDLGIRMAFEEFEGISDIVAGETEKSVVNIKGLRDAMMEAGATAEEVERTIANMDLDDTVVTFDVEGDTEEAIGELEELGIAIRDVNSQEVTIDYGAFAEMGNAIGLSKNEMLQFVFAAGKVDGVNFANANGQIVSLEAAVGGVMDKILELDATEANPTINADTSTATSAVETFIGILNNIPRNIVVKLRAQNDGPMPTLGTFQGKAEGDKNFSGGTVLLGDQYSPTGKPMPELVITKGSAFIAGANGPEIRHLPAGSQILPYSETQKVLARSQQPTTAIPAFGNGNATGSDLWKYYYGSPSGSTGGPTTSTSTSGSNKSSSSSSSKISSKGSSSSSKTSSASGGGNDWESRIKLLESELKLMEAQKKPASELAAKMREIQDALHGQADHLRSIGGDQAEINDLSTEWWNVHEDILDAYREEMKDERDLLESQLELMENQGKSAGDRIAKLKEIQDNLHEEAELLRAVGASQKEINDLSNEWWDIQNDIKGIQEDLWSELEDAVDAELKRARKARDDELEALDNQIKALREAKEEKETQVTLEEKLLAVEEARAALQNAQNERNVRYFNATTGQWEWGADANVVKDAQESLDEATKDLDDYRSEMEYEAAVQAIEERKEAIQKAYENLEEGWEDIVASVQEPTRDISEILADIANYGTPLMKEQVDRCGVLLSDLNNYISAAIASTTGASVVGGGGEFATKDYTNDTTDYSSLMDRAKDEAEFQYWAEQRNNKMKAQGIDPESAGYRTSAEIYEEWKAKKYGSGTGTNGSSGTTSSSSSFGSSGGTTSGSSDSGKNKTVQVQANGKAPSGLSAGDTVVTAGGNYKITKVKADGSYESEKVYDSGGILKGMGGIKATEKDEIVIPPDITDFMLNPSADSVFQQRMSELRYMYGGVPNQNASVAGDAGNKAVYDHSGDEYHYGNITLGEEQAKTMTVYDLAQKARSLGIYSNS